MVCAERRVEHSIHGMTSPYGLPHDLPYDLPMAERRGERSINGVALRSAEKTAEMMEVWRRVRRGRSQRESVSGDRQGRSAVELVGRSR